MSCWSWHRNLTLAESPPSLRRTARPMLLIWTVYRVWGMRSCGESKEDSERGLKLSPKGSCTPIPATSDPLTSGSPYPTPSLMGPRRPPGV